MHKTIRCNQSQLFQPFDGTLENSCFTSRLSVRARQNNLLFSFYPNGKFFVRLYRKVVLILTLEYNFCESLIRWRVYYFVYSWSRDKQKSLLYIEWNMKNMFIRGIFFLEFPHRYLRKEIHFTKTTKLSKKNNGDL